MPDKILAAYLIMREICVTKYIICKWYRNKQKESYKKQTSSNNT